jgi:AraC-like DNA-binding protein
VVLPDLIDRVTDLGKERWTPLLPGLGLARSAAPYHFEAMIYEPLVCLILQGEKEAVAGSRRHVVAAGQAIVVSHAQPVLARVTVARPEAPYLSLVAPLDLALLRSLDHELGEVPLSDAPGSAFLVQPIDPATLRALERLVTLAADPTDARVLGPMALRELHYRLLRGPHGAMLRSLVQRSSHASNIARAIETLRASYRERLQMAAVARSVGMSASSFYEHFKAVTSTTPLQFQKDLRLTEARRLLQSGKHSVATAAFEVGYESPSQFSREYARRFGAPPRAALVPAGP